VEGSLTLKSHHIPVQIHPGQKFTARPVPSVTGATGGKGSDTVDDAVVPRTALVLIDVIAAFFTPGATASYRPPRRCWRRCGPC
jgi:hypothetical protein